MYIRTSSRPSHKRSRTISLIVGSFVILVIIIQFLVPHFLPAIFTTIARPFWRMEFSIESGSLHSPDYILAENEALRLQLQEVMANNASVDQIRTENSELLALFGRTTNSDILVPNMPMPSMSSTTVSSSTSSVLDSINTNNTNSNNNSTNPLAGLTNSSRILGAVLVRPSATAYDEFIIDVGADQGITVGSNVYAPGNILIGTVSDVLGETSKVTLFSSPGQTYPVLIGTSHVPTTAIGRGGGQYEAQIPQATQIAQGDIVLDPSLSDATFGTVMSVIDDPTDPFETILFSSNINIYQLRWVLIDTGKTAVTTISVPTTPKSTVPATTTHSSKVKK